MTHYGAVDANAREARLTLTVYDGSTQPESLSFLIDTGATVAMLLPQETIDRLNLPLADDDEIEITVADDANIRCRIYVASILWHHRVREIEAVNLGSDPLIGMGLLRGSSISIDAAPGGLVAITELPAAS